MKPYALSILHGISTIYLDKILDKKKEKKERKSKIRRTCRLTLYILLPCSFPYYEGERPEHDQLVKSLYKLVADDENGNSVLLGYVPPRVLEQLVRTSVKIKGEMDFSPKARTIEVFNQATEEERSKAVAQVAELWRSKKAFPILDGWRDEVWPVYDKKGQLLYSIERSATGLFGVMRYGVHMTCFVRSPESCHGIKIWVAKRAANKSTFPGMLDNTVAGGLMTGEDPFECIIREAEEEASLPPETMRSLAKNVGQVTYIYITDERAGEAGFIYPELQWIYDLELPDDITPQPQDGEVDSFLLCTVEEVQERLSQGLFKPNCALVVLDFFIRHGILTKENEPDFDEIYRRIHRELPFPGPHNLEKGPTPSTYP
jgi:8-oxo-dGTP pyrophosphatase MutT (NUDIX family)